MEPTTTESTATPTTIEATPTAKKRGRKPNGEKAANSKPGFGMKQLSTCVNKEVKELSQQLEVKEHNIYTAGVLLFNRLSLDDQFTMLNEARKLHATKVREEQGSTATPTA